MSLPKGTRFVSCSGPAPGSKDSSFHAKDYGMLSMVRFILHLPVMPARHNCLPTSNLCSNVSRSISNTQPTSLTQRSTKTGMWSRPLLQHLKALSHSSHLKAYQDDKTEYSKLSLDVDTDHEAGSYQHMNLDDANRVRVIPGNCTNLTINCNTIKHPCGAPSQLRSQTKQPLSTSSSHIVARTYTSNLLLLLYGLCERLIRLHIDFL
jgi:hypothetical protein